MSNWLHINFYYLFLICLVLVGCRPSPQQDSGTARLDLTEDSETEPPVLKALPVPELSADEFVLKYEGFVGAWLEKDRRRPKSLAVGSDEMNFVFSNLAHFSTIESLVLYDVVVGNKEFDLIGRLPNLEAIEFDSCKFTSAQGWSELKNIREIEFEDLRLFDAILADVATVPRVRKITLNNCQIDSFASLAKMKMLRQISFVDQNQVAQPSTLLLLQQLTDLELTISCLKDFPISDLVKLSNLRGLKLSGSSSQGFVVRKAELESLGKIKNLERLTIYNQSEADGSFLKHLPEGLKEFRFTGTLAPEFQGDLSRFRELRVLDLNDRGFSTSAIRSIANKCTKLETLELMYFQTDRVTMTAIGKLKQLKELSIVKELSLFGGAQSSIRNEGGFLVGLTGLSNLKSLTLSGSYLLDEQDAEALGSLVNLEKLWIQHANLGTGVFSGLGNLKNLTELNLSGCRRMKEEHVEAIAKLTELEELILWNVSGRNLGLNALASLSNLRVLDLKDLSTLSNEDLGFVAGTKRLEQLTLGPARKIKDEGLALLGQAPNLAKLEMHKVNVDGTGFEEWPHEHPLKHLDAHGVYFTQAGLESLSKLENLELLSSRVFLLRQSPEITDVCCFENSEALRLLALEGSYVINKKSFDRLHAKRPKLGITFHHHDEE